jgi:hypothetical protein
MSTVESLGQDARTVAVENASYRWAYFFLTFALLVDVMYRSLVRHEAAWDLMALVIASGIISTVYLARKKALTHGWMMKVLLAAIIAAVVAAIAAMTL